MSDFKQWALIIIAGLVVYAVFFKDNVQNSQIQSNLVSEMRDALKNNCNNTTTAGNDRRVCYCTVEYVVNDVQNHIDSVLSATPSISTERLESSVDSFMNSTMTKKMKSGAYQRNCI